MLKIDIINGAYSRCRISGLTSNPTPSDLELALNRLEDMAAMWESRNVCAGYNFEDSPDVNSETNLERSSSSAFQSNLAMLLLADFGKDPHPALVSESSASLSALMATLAKTSTVQYPNRQPLGSGNTRLFNRTRRYYPKIEIPSSPATNYMRVSNVNDFAEHFDAFLSDSETVSSYTITSNSANLSISNDSLTSPDVSYRATTNDQAGVYQVNITATTSIGRITTRLIDFIVES